MGHLARLTQLVAKACAVDIPVNYPVFIEMPSAPEQVSTRQR